MAKVLESKKFVLECSVNCFDDSQKKSTIHGGGPYIYNYLIKHGKLQKDDEATRRAYKKAVEKYRHLLEECFIPESEFKSHPTIQNATKSFIVDEFFERLRAEQKHIKDVINE